jgi:hypothetical protein
MFVFNTRDISLTKVLLYLKNLNLVVSGESTSTTLSDLIVGYSVPCISNSSSSIGG